MYTILTSQPLYIHLDTMNETMYFEFSVDELIQITGIVDDFNAGLTDLNSIVTVGREDWSAGYLFQYLSIKVVSETPVKVFKKHNPVYISTEDYYHFNLDVIYDEDTHYGLSGGVRLFKESYANYDIEDYFITAISVIIFLN